MISFDYSAILRNLLIGDTTLNGLIGNRVFPIVADAGTNFPFIVYRRSSYDKSYGNKDDWDNKFSVELAILADTYRFSIEVLENVIRVLDNYDNGSISIEVTNTFEDFSDDTYIQKVNLDIKYNK